MGMKWVALKVQKIRRDGKTVEVQPGDDIPEAEFWPNRDEIWVKERYIKQTYCPDEEKKPKRKRRTKAEIEAEKAAKAAEESAAKAAEESAAKAEEIKDDSTVEDEF